MVDYVYVGEELTLFAKAANWKAYWLRQIAPFVSGDVADVGAGIGSTLIEGVGTLKYKSWVAIEPDRSLHSILTQNIFNLNIPNAVALNATLDGVDSRFDTILYVDVLEHIEDDKKELENAATRLNSKGRIVAIGPAHNFLFSDFDIHVGHYRRYNKKMIQAITPSGFKLEFCFYLDSVGMLLSAANRLLLKKSLPSERQIKFWDSMIIPASRFLDVSVGFNLGKTIVAIWTKD